jgi:hypothetical protein
VHNWETTMPTSDLTQRLRAHAQRLDEQTCAVTLDDVEAHQPVATSPGRPVGFAPSRPRALVALAAAAVVVIAAVGVVLAVRPESHGSNAPVHPAGSGPTLPATGTPTTAPRSSQSTSAPTTPATTAKAVTNGAAPMNLVTTNAVRAALVDAFATGQHISRSYVAGTAPGSVYYAYDPGTHAYWALAQFSSSAAAAQAHQQFAGTAKDPYIQFQDGPWIFKSPDNSSWTLVGDTGGTVCPSSLPMSLVRLWNLHNLYGGTNPGCP